MATTAKPGFAHRFGHAVGTVIGRFLAFEPRLARAFRRRGLPPVLVKLLFWSVKLAVIAALIYVAYWVAIFVGMLFILAAIGEGLEDGLDDLDLGTVAPFMVPENMNGSSSVDPGDPGYYEREAGIGIKW